MLAKPYLGPLRMSIRAFLLENDVLFSESLIDLLGEEDCEVHHYVNAQGT